VIEQRLRMLALAATLAVLAAAFGGGLDAAAANGAPDNTLTVYSRERVIAEPLFQLFERESGIKIRARWGDPIKLADQILQDGAASPADVFYGPLSDALGSLSASGRLARLSEGQLARVPEAYRSPDGIWVGTGGRAHVVFYNADKVSEAGLPDSILGFADPAWRGRIGWDPTSRSLQDVVTEVRQLEGEDAARAWLEGIKNNGAAVVQGAPPIITAVGAGDIIDVGFGSHSYLPSMQADGDATNVAARFYVGGAPGGLLNVAGVGIIKGTKKEAAANAFVDFMLSPTAQQYLAGEAFEIPLVEGVQPPKGTPTAAELTVPGLDVRQFEELRGARKLLTEVGIVG
jgi:iron(III) transport system substrate-binding protein